MQTLLIARRQALRRRAPRARHPAFFARAPAASKQALSIRCLDHTQGAVRTLALLSTAHDAVTIRKQLMLTTTSPLNYYERATCSAQWLAFNRALAAELSAGLPPEENRRLFFRIGESVATGLPVARCHTLAELQTAINARWEAIDWGFATLEESAQQLSIVHACSPIAMAFGPDTLEWTAGFFEGAYQTWFAAQGAPGELKVRADVQEAAGGPPTVVLKLGRFAA